MRISEQSIQAAKDVPLIDIIQHYVQLKPIRSRYRGLCPFHKERTPSFFVTPGRGYKCFGCPAKGSNAVDFIMRHDGKSFTEAAIEVLTLAGIEVLESNEQYHKQIPVFKKAITIKRVPTLSFIPQDLFIKSLQLDQNVLQIAKSNKFVQFLIHLFGPEITSQLVSKYFLGTSKYKFKNKDFPNYEAQSGATIFWQRDIQGNIRTGKIMLYNANTGKRIREPFHHIAWIHIALRNSEFELKQCLFGEHLLKDQLKPVAITESEKAAIIASVYFPQFIWLAVGGLENLKYEQCKVLTGRKVILFPDLNGLENWNLKAIEFQGISKFQLFDLLHNKANELDKRQGLDIADYLVQFDYREFQKDLGTNNHQSNKGISHLPKLQIENNTPENTTNLDVKHESDHSSFIDNTGRLFIKPPSCKKFTVYQSIAEYNERKGYPSFKDLNEVNIESMKRVNIDPNTFKILF